jgi:hypothetical protein
MKALVMLWKNKPDPAQQQPAQMPNGNGNTLPSLHGAAAGHKNVISLFVAYPLLDTRYSCFWKVQEMMPQVTTWLFTFSFKVRRIQSC